MEAKGEVEPLLKKDFWNARLTHRICFGQHCHAPGRASHPEAGY
jgi:hypothetical protein